ncbi:MAG: NAD(P)H-hydrate epimerase, partial [Crenarchaeota archaeon]|nr:NAD(P)H-hydrate epimerase [Thermoproteota archaeon]
MQAENIYISSREMRSLEVNAEYFGFNLLQLMEMAGRNVAQEIIMRFPKGKKVAIFCGLGGNGGDGFVIARHLFAADFEVSVFLIGKSRDVNHESARINYQILQS